MRKFKAGLPVVCTVIGPGFGNFRVFLKKVFAGRMDDLVRQNLKAGALVEVQK